MATTKRVRFALSEEQEKRQQAREETSHLKPIIEEALATAPDYQHSEYQALLQPALAAYLTERYAKNWMAYQTLDKPALINNFQRQIATFFAMDYHIPLIEPIQQEQIKKLTDACESYQRYLWRAIAALAQALPKPMREQYYDENRQLQVQNIIDKVNLGRSLFAWELQFEQGLPHSAEVYPKLHQTIKKYTVAKTLQEHLLNPDLSLADRLIRFQAHFNQPDVQHLLKAQRDPAGLRFLKAVGHILTLGIVSKVTKGTFAFWKTHGEVISQRVEAAIDLPSKPALAVRIK